MTIIANPIYDSVFEFLMEDERAAKVLLSALLKQEVLDLKIRPNKSLNLNQTRISLFRMYFSARIKDNASKEELVLIELQKTWVATENLHLRQYLSAQYLPNENVTEKEGNTFDLPNISIYILGHKLGDVNEPVVYVRRRFLDYDNQELFRGITDPFIENLTHDSIIVQTPYLHGHAHNHLECLLSIFDQNCCLEIDNHLLLIDNQGMNKEDQWLIDRLVMAAASPIVRRKMQVEDEILPEIEDRDTTIMLKNREIELKNREIERINQKHEQINQMNF